MKPFSDFFSTNIVASLLVAIVSASPFPPANPVTDSKAGHHALFSRIPHTATTTLLTIPSAHLFIPADLPYSIPAKSIPTPYLIPADIPSSIHVSVVPVTATAATTHAVHARNIPDDDNNGDNDDNDNNDNDDKPPVSPTAHFPWLHVNPKDHSPGTISSMATVTVPMTSEMAMQTGTSATEE